MCRISCKDFLKIKKVYFLNKKKHHDDRYSKEFFIYSSQEILHEISEDIKRTQMLTAARRKFNLKYIYSIQFSLFKIKIPDH